MSFQIDEIILYKSGVGFFTGKSKNKEFILPINEADVDDVLKSLSVDGLKSVTFNASEKKEDIKRKIGIDINSQSAFLSFSKHLIGLKAEIKLIDNNSFNGEIIGIDTLHSFEQQQNLISFDVLVLQEENIIRYLPIGKISHLRILNENIYRDLEVFLNLEAITRKLGVINLKVTSQENNAKIHWVSPLSAWRLSYRVQFDEEKGETHFAGIAIVDNTTSIDWENIKLQLATGQPVSFKYDLHSPLNIDRPLIPRDESGVTPYIDQPNYNITKQSIGFGRGRRGVPPRAKPVREPTTGQAPILLEEKNDWDIARDVISLKIQSSTEEVGATTIYQIIKPVTINQSESSLIPLFLKKMNGELSVLVRDDRIDDAMDAILFPKPLELEKGVATIYIDNIFAGDAIVVRGTDYITFKLNQEIKIFKEIQTASKITKINLSYNLMYQTFTETNTLTFKMLNTTSKKIPLILEIAKMTGYNPETKPIKETINYLRYKIDLLPGTSEKTFNFIRTYDTSIYIKDLPQETINTLLKEGILDEKDHTQVLKIFEKLKLLLEKEKELEKIDEEINWEYSNQARLRDNIKMFQDINQSPERQEYINRLKSSEKLLEQLDTKRKELIKEIGKLKDQI